MTPEDSFRALERSHRELSEAVERYAKATGRTFGILDPSPETLIAFLDEQALAVEQPAARYMTVPEIREWIDAIRRGDLDAVDRLEEQLR